MKDVVQSVRKLFYTQMAIDAKHEETMKLSEYIIMEQERLVEAKIKFEEDCDKFNRFVRDVENMTEKAQVECDAATKQRYMLHLEIEDLQNEIEQIERQCSKIDETIKDFSESRDFVEQVKALQKTIVASPEAKRVVKKKKQQEEEQSAFFITEKLMREKEELARIQLRNHDPFGVGISRLQFLELIQEIEDQNIFILTLIEQTEDELEKLHHRGRTRFKKDIRLIEALKLNNQTYQGLIEEKSDKQVALEKCMGVIKHEEEKSGMIESPMPKEEEEPGSQKRKQADSTPTKSSPQKTSAMSMISQDGQPERKLTEFELMKQLKHRIYMLYLVATGSSNHMSI